MARKSARDESSDGKQTPRQSGNVTQVNLAEWIAAAASAALLVAMIAFLVYEGVNNETTVPRLSARVGHVEESGGGYLVEFRALNHGDATAADVKVEGRLARNGRPVEASAVVLDYVPARSESGGGLVFSRDPREHELQVRIVGYAEP